MDARAERCLVVVIGMIAGCSDRPLTTAGESEGATTESSVAADPGVTGGLVPTSSDTGGVVSEGDGTGMDGGSTGSNDDDDETAATTTSGGVVTPCGACAEVWEHDGSLQLEAGQELAQFDCLVAVHGDLGISGDISAEALAVLGNVTQIDGRLGIANNAVLADLAPFSCLVAANGGVALLDLPALTDVSGLARLEVAPQWWIQDTAITGLPASVKGIAGVEAMKLFANPNLVDLSGAKTWTGRVGTADNPVSLQFDVRWNAALTNLDGLQGLVGGEVETSSVILEDLPALVSLLGLETMGGDRHVLELRHLPALPSLAGLGGLTGGQVTLVGLPLVTDLSPLSNMTSATELVLDGMPLVSSLDGLGGLVDVGALFLGERCEAEAEGMDGLVDLAGLAALVAAGHLEVYRSDSFSAFSGAPGLMSLGSLTALFDPLLGEATTAAFIAQFAPTPDTCLDPDVCGACLDDDGSR